MLETIVPQSIQTLLKLSYMWALTSKLVNINPNTFFQSLRCLNLIVQLRLDGIGVHPDLALPTTPVCGLFRYVWKPKFETTCLGVDE
jgi:hypothetical protein